MNDFTKDELGTIFLDMNHNILKHGKENVAPFYLKLRDKVESMIDNYCEHPKSYGYDSSLSQTKNCDHEFKLCKSFYGLREHKYRCTKCLLAYDEMPKQRCGIGECNDYPEECLRCN